MSDAIQIRIEGGLDRHDISLVQAIRAGVEKSLVPLGFAYSSGEYGGDKVVLNFRQFGICHEGPQS